MADTDAAADAASLDAQIREHELSAYRHYGIEPEEEMLLVDTYVGERQVRVMHFGPQDSPLPPVLVMHGVGSFSVLAVEMFSYLTGRRVMVMDWPGHGLSGECVLPNPNCLRDMAVSTLRGILDDLAIPVVDLIAHSVGSQFSLYAAIDMPRRVRRMVLMGAPAGAFPKSHPILPMLLMATPVLGRAALAREVTESSFTWFNNQAIGVGAGAHLPPGVMAAGRLISNRPSYPASVNSYCNALVRGRSVRPVNHIGIEELSRITHPTLIVWGDKDAFQSPMLAAPSIVAIRYHRLIRLPYAGHAPWLDEPELVGTAIAEHLSG
ncbi:MAG: alpha/beta hydrolase [Dermatophilaceae bacterium]